LYKAVALWRAVAGHVPVHHGLQPAPVFLSLGAVEAGPGAFLAVGVADGPVDGWGRTHSKAGCKRGNQRRKPSRPGEIAAAAEGTQPPAWKLWTWAENLQNELRQDAGQRWLPSQSGGA